MRGIVPPTMKRAVLIVNPFASRVTEEGIAAVERALMRSAYERTVRTERARHAVELARDAGEADALVVFSGDGGFNEALNGVERDDLPLGFVPGGGTSVLPRALGLPRDPVEAAERLADAMARDRTRRISTGRVNGRRFAFSAGVRAISPSSGRSHGCSWSGAAASNRRSRSSATGGLPSCSSRT